MAKHLIYMATSPSGKAYIGQTSRTLRKRWGSHCNMAAWDPYMAISKAIVKYGKDSFRLVVLCDNIPEGHDANKLEIYFINYYSTYKNGYNNTPGGAKRSNLKYGNRLGQKNTEEHNAKISKAHMGKRLSFEHRKNISLGKKKEPSVSDETRLALSKAAKKFWAKRKASTLTKIEKTEKGKVCSRCGKFKKYSEFYNIRDCCKECVRNRKRTWEKERRRL